MPIVSDPEKMTRALNLKATLQDFNLKGNYNKISRLDVSKLYIKMFRKVLTRRAEKILKITLVIFHIYAIYIGGGGAVRQKN